MMWCPSRSHPGKDTRKFTLHFGRETDDVHVPIGINDPHVSRLHGVLMCDGREWWVRNEGRLPIQLPEAMPLRQPA
jgi:hypothetical protein